MPPERRGNLALPFFHLRSSKFWHLIPRSGDEESLASVGSAPGYKSWSLAPAWMRNYTDFSRTVKAGADLGRPGPTSEGRGRPRKAGEGRGMGEKTKIEPQRTQRRESRSRSTREPPDKSAGYGQRRMNPAEGEKMCKKNEWVNEQERIQIGVGFPAQRMGTRIDLVIIYELPENFLRLV
jgi:hypothetical protein